MPSLNHGQWILRTITIAIVLNATRIKFRSSLIVHAGRSIVFNHKGLPFSIFSLRFRTLQTQLYTTPFDKEPNTTSITSTHSTLNDSSSPASQLDHTSFATREHHVLQPSQTCSRVTAGLSVCHQWSHLGGAASLDFIQPLVHGSSRLHSWQQRPTTRRQP